MLKRGGCRTPAPRTPDGRYPRQRSHVLSGGLCRDPVAGENFAADFRSSGPGPHIRCRLGGAASCVLRVSHPMDARLQVQVCDRIDQEFLQLGRAFVIAPVAIRTKSPCFSAAIGRNTLYRQPRGPDPGSTSPPMDLVATSTIDAPKHVRHRIRRSYRDIALASVTDLWGVS